MRFCQKCGSLYFVKKQDDQKLIYECRACGFCEDWDQNYNEPIYSNDIISTDYMSYDLSSNPFTIMDPTLPRLNNIKCINSKCLTNTLNHGLVLIVGDESRKDVIITFINNLMEKNIFSDTQVNEKYYINAIKIENSDITNYGELQLSCGKLINENIKENNNLSYFQITFENDKKIPITLETFNSIVELLQQNGDIDNLCPNEIKQENELLSLINREVVSIKYDEINMKYMYICCTCGSSWKNIN